MSKTILYNKRISGGNTNPDFKLHYTVTVIKTMWYNNRQGDQWERTQDPEINSHTHRHLKKPKPYNVKKEASSITAARIKCHVEECK